jgi:DNA-binding beta-propeller fold protein YncE
VGRRRESGRQSADWLYARTLTPELPCASIWCPFRACRHKTSNPGLKPWAVTTVYPAAHGTFIIGESATPDGQYLYVLGETPDTVVTVALGSNTVVGQPVPVGFGGRIAIAPDGKYAYVSGQSSPTRGKGQVKIIDITSQ